MQKQWADGSGPWGPAPEWDTWSGSWLQINPASNWGWVCSTTLALCASSWEAINHNLRAAIPLYETTRFAPYVYCVNIRTLPHQRYYPSVGAVFQSRITMRINLLKWRNEENSEMKYISTVQKNPQYFSIASSSWFSLPISVSPFPKNNIPKAPPPQC